MLFNLSILFSLLILLPLLPLLLIKFCELNIWSFYFSHVSQNQQSMVLASSLVIPTHSRWLHLLHMSHCNYSVPSLSRSLLPQRQFTSLLLLSGRSLTPSSATLSYVSISAKRGLSKYWDRSVSLFFLVKYNSMRRSYYRIILARVSSSSWVKYSLFASK